MVDSDTDSVMGWPSNVQHYSFFCQVKALLTQATGLKGRWWCLPAAELPAFLPCLLSTEMTLCALWIYSPLLISTRMRETGHLVVRPLDEKWKHTQIFCTIQSSKCKLFHFSCLHLKNFSGLQYDNTCCLSCMHSQLLLFFQNMKAVVLVKNEASYPRSSFHFR